MKINMNEEKTQQLVKEILEFAHKNNLKVRKKGKQKSKST